MPDSVALAGRITADGHELIQRVYFEDTDFSGRVYHARYLHFLERGRSDYLRLLGVHHQELAAKGLAFAVHHMEIDFLRPAGIDDVLTIRSRIAALGGARVELRQEIHSAPDLLARAVVAVALLGASGRPVRLPAAIRDALRRAA